MDNWWKIKVQSSKHRPHWRDDSGRLRFVEEGPYTKGWPPDERMRLMFYFKDKRHPYSTFGNIKFWGYDRLNSIYTRSKYRLHFHNPYEVPDSSLDKFSTFDTFMLMRDFEKRHGISN